MKLQIHLTEAMAHALLMAAHKARRFPRQQAEVLLERALGVSTPHKPTPRVGGGEDMPVEVDYAAAPASD
jgi:hypothetical protein